MKEPFGTILSVILVIIGLFLIPLQYFANKQDAISQAYVYSLVTDFVEEVQLNGYISQDQYNKFTKSLSNTAVMYTIEMTHAHDVVSPTFNEDGDAVTGTKTVPYVTYEDEILEKLFDKDGMYYFEKGDHFTLSVRNKTRTMGQKINTLITNSSVKYTLVATYGATIRNEKY